MAVRYTGSRGVLEEIRDTLSTMSGNLATEATMGNTGHKIDEVLLEAKKTRIGHEQYLWEEKVEVDEDDLN